MDENQKLQRIKKSSLITVLPIVTIFLVWLYYMSATDKWFLFTKNWYMSVTMVFGSFIAGASSEGGGAVAFPVMTLLYKIIPSVARNFGFAIQSIGMTAASWLIIRNRYPLELRYLVPVSIGGIFGIVLGTNYLVPLIPVAYIKMLFVTFWLSFGIILFYINHIYKRNVFLRLPQLGGTDILFLMIVGILGGGLSSLLGSGIDIFSFSYVTMRYHLSEKVATPTSVVIMAINSITGFFYHAAVLHDFGPREFNYWLVCIPVVICGAPIGAYVINRLTRKVVAFLLYIIIVIQFIGALVIIKPQGMLLVFTSVIFIFGVLFFFSFSYLSRKNHNNMTDQNLPD